MGRDLAIQRTFETADDSLHGIIGYYLYTIAMQKAVDEKEILQYLPEKSFQTTFSMHAALVMLKKITPLTLLTLFFHLLPGASNR